MRAKHEDAGANQHPCDNCGKSFSRKEHLKRHQDKNCSALKVSCVRCHRLFGTIAALTEHMGLCPVPTCATCQMQFPDKDDLQEHNRLAHRKRQLPSSKTSDKKRKGTNFYCRLCLTPATSRQALFDHKLEHLPDPKPWQTVEPHWDFEDNDINQLIEQNKGVIFAPHRIGDVVSNFNFPITLQVKSEHWMTEISTVLERVADLSTEEAFKLNFSCGFILVNRETGAYRYFAPNTNNAFLKEPT